MYDYYFTTVLANLADILEVIEKLQVAQYATLAMLGVVVVYLGLRDIFKGGKS